MKAAPPGHVRVVPITLRGGVKCFALAGRQALLVDAGNAGDGRRIRDILPHHAIKLTDLSLVLVTHAHPDHVGGLAYLKQRLGTPIAIHALDAAALRQGRNHPLRGTGMLGSLLAMLMGGGMGYAAVEPDVLVEEELDLRPYGIEGQAIWTPGHTPGSLSVILSNGEAFVGDLLMGGMLSRGKPRYPLFADDLDQVRASIRKVLAYPVSKIYTAHGGPFEAEEVRQAFLGEPAIANL